MKDFKLKKADIIVLAAVFCIAAVAFACVTFLPSRGSVAVIEQKGAVIAELPLDENTVFEVKDGGRVTNVVEVKDGAISVTKADCPDKICQNHRAVSKSGESIICLPNRVIVTVRGEGREVDGVAR